jgi:DmsE family decaheme c-type cytochrome
MRSLLTFTVGCLSLALVGTLAAAQDNSLRYKLKPGANGTLCLKCHVPFKDKLAKSHVHTPVKKGDCSGCHNPHAAAHGKLLSADAKEICNSCHASLVPASAKSRHKVVVDGECVKCHDPHASDTKDVLVKGGSELCFACHKELATSVGSAKFKHAPVEKGCLTCHDPHAGKGPALLNQDVNSLCLGCHKQDRPNFAKAHMSYPVTSARCTACHDPHGSNRPKILYNNVHAPVANRMCNQCHEEGALRLKRSGSEMCRGCHTEMYNKTFAKNRVHWPLASKDGCLSCHDPHAGPVKGLLKDKPAQLCGSCHGDTMRRFDKLVSKHEPVKNGECTACHDPHSSNVPFLAQKEKEIDLCATCHDWVNHSTHPIGEKYKDPRNKNLTLSCHSCHRTHGTEFKKMLPTPTTTELCVQCHEQYKR